MNIPDTYDTLFYNASVAYDVPFAWLKAIAGTESDWNPNAYRDEPKIGDASYGLMQLLTKTAYALGYRGEAEGLYDPETNINLGAALIAQNISRFGEDFDAVYSAYNSGSPTKYKTSSEVAAHVDRARRYLAAVEQTVVEVTSEESGSIGIGVLIFIIGIAVFFASRGH